MRRWNVSIFLFFFFFFLTKTFHSSCFQSCDTKKSSGELSFFPFFSLRRQKKKNFETLFSRAFSVCYFRFGECRKNIARKINFSTLEDISAELWGILKFHNKNFGKMKSYLLGGKIKKKIVFPGKSLDFSGLQTSATSFYCSWKKNQFCSFFASEKSEAAWVLFPRNFYCLMRANFFSSLIGNSKISRHEFN